MLHAQPTTTPDEKTVAFLKQFRSDFIKTMLDENRSNIQGYYAGNMRLMPESFKKPLWVKAMHLNTSKLLPIGLMCGNTIGMR
jgi:hypothetical protein